MNPRFGGSSPPQVETFFVSKSLTLSQEHPPVRESKMNAVARAQLTFQMSTLLQKYHRTYCGSPFQTGNETYCFVYFLYFWIMTKPGVTTVTESVCPGATEMLIVVTPILKRWYLGYITGFDATKSCMFLCFIVYPSSLRLINDAIINHLYVKQKRHWHNKTRRNWVRGPIATYRGESYIKK